MLLNFETAVRSCISKYPMYKFFLLLLSVFFVSSGALLAESTQNDPLTFSYRGFQANEAQVLDVPYLSKANNSIKRQIDLLYHLGLSPEVLIFFQSISIKVINDTAGAAAGREGEYQQGEGNGIILNIAINDGNPEETTLLHELLHAFHDQRLRDGFADQTIMTYYQDAVNRRCYNWVLDSPNREISYCFGYTDTTNYDLTNQREFFAVTATTYLFGQDPDREPHLRQDIQQKQRDYYLYLKQLFGSTAGSYYDSSWSGSAERYGLEFEDEL